MATAHVRKPDWLKIRLSGNDDFRRTKEIVESHGLHTICTSGKCPNQGECWSRGTATFMIGGDICTRSCRFCNTLTGRPHPLDPTEPDHATTSIPPGQPPPAKALRARLEIDGMGEECEHKKRGTP